MERVVALGKVVAYCALDRESANRSASCSFYHHLLRLNSAGAGHHDLRAARGLNGQGGVLKQFLRHARRFLRQFDVAVALVHFLHVCEQFNGVGVGLVINDTMMHAAKQDQICKGVPCVLRLLRVEPWPASILCFDVTNFPYDRPAGMDNRCIALWISAAVARKRKELFNGLV